jgi:hypothetical protein
MQPDFGDLRSPPPLKRAFRLYENIPALECTMTLQKILQN